MADALLSVNAGSSSVKTRLYRRTDGRPLPIATAQVTGLNYPPANLTYTHGSRKTAVELDKSIVTPIHAFKAILDLLINDSELHELSSQDSLGFICHRVVHGGDYGREALITNETYHHIENLEDLAPLHNASAVDIIKNCLDELPTVRNIAFFDSAFHQTMPDYVKTYVIDQKIAKEKGLRKYGFHGISYRYIIRVVAGFLNKSQEETNIIALHLGSGSSICVIENGKSIDTTMGLTPVAGLPGATRTGDIDPSLVFHYTSEAARLSPGSTKHLHITMAEDILNKQSGWKALAGTSDFAQIASPDGDESCRLAFNIFVDRICGYVGNYFVKLGGNVDALVFSGGIGENSARLRAEVVERCKCLGFSIDEGKNNGGEKKGEESDVTEISGSGSKLKVLICRTDEEAQMAKTTIENWTTYMEAELT